MPFLAIFDPLDGVFGFNGNSKVHYEQIIPPQTISPPLPTPPSVTYFDLSRALPPSFFNIYNIVRPILVYFETENNK